MVKTKRSYTKIALAWGVFVCILAATIIAEYFVQMHPFFGLDGRMFFHAWFGLVMCTIMILFSKILSFSIKRQEGYYKENKND